MPPDAEELQKLVACNRIGWNAIRHKDGWWVGTEDGVTCYRNIEVARAALTIIWQREGGGSLNYRIQPYTGANKQVGEHTPPKTAIEAIKSYESKPPTS